MNEYEKSLLKAINSKYENREKFEFIRQDLQFIKALEKLKETEIEVPYIDEILGDKEVEEMTEKEFKNLGTGKTFNANGKRFIVVESIKTHCKGCFFEGGKNFDCNEWSLDLPYCTSVRREDGKNVVFKEVKTDVIINKNKPHSDEILSFEEIVRSGLNISIKVDKTEFLLTYNDKKQAMFTDKFLILVRQSDEDSWDIIGEETDYKEAELCFITEVSRYRDLSYDEV
jgi:hypothetical protein